MSHDEEEEPTRQSTRATRPIARLEPRLIGQTSYNQLEYCHNLILQTEPDPSSMNKEYTASDAMLSMGRLIDDLNSKISRNCFPPISIAEMTQSERRKAQQALSATENNGKPNERMAIKRGLVKSDSSTQEHCDNSSY
jgi:hypothetical protein